MNPVETKVLIAISTTKLNRSSCEAHGVVAGGEEGPASCITQLKAQRPSRTCNESKEEEEGTCIATPRSKARAKVTAPPG